MTLLQTLKAEDARLRKLDLARLSLLHFITYLNPNYTLTWAHRKIIETVEAVILGDLQRAMVCVPPQIGKSTISSIYAPCWAAGQNIDEKIAGISYAISLASRFNKQAQRIYNTNEYRDVFPNNFSAKTIGGKNEGKMRANSFDFLDSKGQVHGAYTSYGIGGGITGESTSLIVLDDTIKNADQAYRANRRDKDWENYTSSIMTRMVSGTRVISTATPWHKDDIQGRILTLPDADKWEKVFIPALRQNKPITIENDNWKFELTDLHNEDPREEGESIWEAQRPREQLLGIKEIDPFVFQAMYQVQPPTARSGGNLWLHSIANREHLYCDVPKVGGGQYIVSFDNNLEPVSAIVAYWEFHPDFRKCKFWVLKEYQVGYTRTDGKKMAHPSSDTPIEDICAQIRKDFGQSAYIITGDSALHNRAHGAKGGSPSSIIRTNINGANKIPKQNLGLASSYNLCNAVINAGCLLVSKNCPILWREMNEAQSTEDKDIVKDRTYNFLDLFDAMRYGIHTCFEKIKFI